MRVPPAAILLALVLAALPQTAGAAGPALVAPPAIDGTLRVGERIAATAGSWSASGTAQYAYAWSRCDRAISRCVPIRGATRATYTLVTADAGRTVALAVKATDSTGTTTAYASAVGPVAPRPATLVSTARPVVEGAAVVGTALKTSTGTWTPAATQLAYAWERCNDNGRICTPIPGATADTYTPVAADVGKTLVAVVKATSGAFTQATFGVATRPVKAQPGPTPIARPSIAGTLRAGERLTAAPGSWSGSGTVTYAYAWYRCDAAGAKCVPIRGATGGGYRLVAADAGRTIALNVKATDATGSADGYASAAGPIAAAKAANASKTRPAISGAAAVGRQLKVDAGTWATAPVAVTYAWQRCNANGRVCAAIPGAATDTYSPVAADVGHALLVLVRAGTQATFSAATTPVTVA